MNNTDATGVYKDAEFLLKDIKEAIAKIGQENVFIVAMDGACKKTLRLITEDMTMHRIFAQRCSTHGCNLLVADIAKHFAAEILLCVRLVKFIVNHDGIFAMLSKMENSLQLFAAVETRFCSQIYSSERVLADKQFIREIFSSAALMNYLANAHPELRSEYEKLDIDLVSNASSWARIQTFVAVEIPVRKLLRMSDGHTPNLPHMCHGFENAQKESLEAVQAATLEFPEIYTGLEEKVITAFSRRKKDIVTPLCLAACMVLPSHVYGVANEAYNPPGGNEAIIAAIERFYHGNIGSQVEALKSYQDFREKNGYFATEKAIWLANNDTAENFWKIAAVIRPEGAELFRKLCNGYAGQGESERMNKNVKKFRTTDRNRQSHDVMKSFMELDSIYRMIDKRDDSKTQAPYLEILRERIHVIVEENDEVLLAEAEARINEAEEIEVSDEIDEVDDADYGQELVDEGVNALLMLLNH